MPNSADTLRDPARLAALGETGLAGSPPEESFDRLTRMAARLLGAPMSALSLVDGEWQTFKSHTGLPDALRESGGTPVGQSICALVVASAQPLVAPDTHADPRLSAHPMVTEIGVRAYAGFPVATRDGHVLGSFCVADTRPHEWSQEDLGTLRDLAAIAAERVDARRAEEERRRSEAVLREAGEWFRSLVEQTIAGVYVYQDGRFRYVNPRFAQIFDRPVPELTAPDALARIVHPDDYAQVEENIRLRLTGEIPTLRYGLRGVRSDGCIIHLEVHGRRTVLEGKPALVGVGIDVTERVRAEREREAARASRDRFYAMVSHELRTPISTIMLYNDLLASGVYDALTDTQREAVERSQSSARHLLELINDLLDLSKLEAGKMEARSEEVEVAELVDAICRDLRPLAHDHGCDLAVHLPVRPLPVHGDGRRIRQILLNLLSNAIKFGRGHPILLAARPHEDRVCVEVTDHGPGIAEDDIPRIFEDFVQLGEGDGGGTGLGLPIARRLAEMLGGTIHVASTPGRGSTFRFEIPAVPAPTA